MQNYSYDFGNDFLNDLYACNRLQYLYDFGYIDYALFKSISLIKSYKGYATNMTYKSDIRFTHRELIKHLLSNVLMWYKRSKINLKHDTKKHLLNVIKDIIKINEFNNSKDYFENTYIYIPRKNNMQYKQNVLSA